MIQRLGSVVPDLGRETAGDATSLNARRQRKSRAKSEEQQGLPQASGSRKEYRDEKGDVTKVVEWFGFKLHLLVGVILAVHAGFATLLAMAPRWEGSLGQTTRSPIVRAL